MSTLNLWYVGSSMVVELQGLQDTLTETPVTTALVQATLLDTNGNVVAGESWPLTLAHVSAGTYRGVASYVVSVKEKARYTCRVTAAIGGIHRRWDIPVTARADNT
jgi:hypothetical protein